MSDNATTSLAVYAHNNLNARDALAVQIVANRNGVTAREIGVACGRAASWFGGRVPTVNKALSKIALEIGVRPGSHGYELRELAPEVKEPEPELVVARAGSARQCLAEAQLRSAAPLAPETPTVVEQALAAPPAPPKVHAHFVTVNGRLFDFRRMITVTPEEARQRVVISMQWGGYQHIPAPGPGRARAIADKIIRMKQAEDGVIVTDLNEGEK